MIFNEKFSRMKKFSAFVLLGVFVSYLCVPTLAFSRPPNIYRSTEEITDSWSTGDPVGGERKDEKDPAGGGMSIHEGLAQGEGLSLPDGALPVARDVRVIVLPLIGVWGGKTLTIIFNPFLRVSGVER